jgi:phage terminase small subunit
VTGAAKKAVAKKAAPRNPPKISLPKLRPLNPQQQMFVSEYLKDRIAGKAAARAGYSKKNADQIGYQLLQKPSVRAAADAGLEKLLADNNLTAARVMKEIARLATFDVAKLYDDDGKLKDISKIDADTRASIIGIEVEGAKTNKAGQTTKVKVADKVAALRMAAQHFALLKEHVEITGKDGGPIETRELSDAERAVRLVNLLARAAERAKTK